MLLILGDQIRDHLPRILASVDLRDALSNLARAHHEGKHILSGSAVLLGRLAEARELPEDVRGMWKQIKQRHLDAASVRASVTHLAEIELREGDIHEEGDSIQRRFRVPLSFFRDSAQAQASRLVAEDRDDARVYERAALAYASRHAKRLTVRLQSYGGGGSSVADALRDHAREGPTLCIVDADLKWSEAEGAPDEGGTARDARRAARQLAGEVMCTVYASPCHEIENLFPHALVLECLRQDDKTDFVKRCERIAALGLFGGGPSVNRLDLKKGLRRWDFDALPDGPRRLYLARIFAEHHHLVQTPRDGWCGDTRECQAADACRCVLFEGIGDSILARVADRFESLTPQKIAECLLAADQRHVRAWIEIGRLLFSWGCGYPRTRT